MRTILYVPATCTCKTACITRKVKDFRWPVPFSCVRCLVSFTRRRSLRVVKTSQAAAWLGVRRRRLQRFRVVASRSVPVPGLDFEATSLRALGRLQLLARWFDSERRRLQARSRLPTVAFVRVSRVSLRVLAAPEDFPRW